MFQRFIDQMFKTYLEIKQRLIDEEVLNKN